MFRRARSNDRSCDRLNNSSLESIREGRAGDSHRGVWEKATTCWTVVQALHRLCAQASFPSTSPISCDELTLRDRSSLERAHPQPRKCTVPSAPRTSITQGPLAYNFFVGSDLERAVRHSGKEKDMLRCHSDLDELVLKRASSRGPRLKYTAHMDKDIMAIWTAPHDSRIHPHGMESSC